MRVLMLRLIALGFTEEEFRELCVLLGQSAAEADASALRFRAQRAAAGQ